MKKIGKHNIEVNQKFPFKTHDLLSTSNSLIENVNDWSKQTKTRMVYSTRRSFIREVWVKFAFKSEEDLSMFILRWGSVFEEEYQNSQTLYMSKILAQIADIAVFPNKTNKGKS